MRRILCPIDFSESSRQALDYAIAFARWYEARITVLHVSGAAQPALAAGAVGGGEVFGLDRISDQERCEVLRHVDRFITQDLAAGAPLDPEVTLDGGIARPIMTRARELHADLIAIGTHGQSGLDHVLLGSVAEKVLHQAHCPVLAVPALAHETVPVGLDRLICAVDFSKGSASQLEYAVSLAERAGARIAVLHVLDLPPDLPQLQAVRLAEYRCARFEQARGWMRRLVTASQRARCHIDELLLVGSPWREIVRTAAEQQADIVVMGALGRGSVDTTLVGSTTQHVVQGAPCPVLTVR